MRGIHLLLVALLVGAWSPASTAGEPQVSIENGLVSVTFHATVARDAVQAIRRATSVDLLLPPAAAENTVTLRMERTPLERVLQRFVEALDLAGFVLVYASDGMAERTVLVRRGADASPRPPTRTEGQPPQARAHGRRGGPPVPFLMRKTEAESMKLGSGEHRIVVDAAPFARVQTSECNGVSGRYPVQNVLITVGPNTSISSVVVCAPEGLQPGEVRTVTPAQSDPSVAGNADYVMFRASAPSRLP